MTVLAVDPGTAKCGLAVVGPDGVRDHQVVPTGRLRDEVAAWIARHRPDRVLLGNGTAMKAARRQLEGLAVEVELVEERHTTERARQRYFVDHPARGWRRLLPSGLRLPAEPYDDYAAVVLAEDYLRRQP